MSGRDLIGKPWRSDLFGILRQHARCGGLISSRSLRCGIVRQLLFYQPSGTVPQCFIIATSFPVCSCWYAVKVVFFALRCFVPCFLWCFTVCSTGSGLPGILSAVSWAHFLCNLCLLHHNHKKSILHFLCFLHRVPPSPLPLQFCPVSAAFMLFIRFIFAFRLGSGSLRPCPVSLVTVEALPLVSVLRGSDRCQKERKNRKARVLPCGSALALWYHVGTLPGFSILFRNGTGSRQALFMVLPFPPLCSLCALYLCVCYTSVCLVFLILPYIFHTSTRCQPSRVPGSSGTP